MSETQLIDDTQSEPQRFNVALFIVHPDMAPEIISSELGLVATMAWQAGELRKAPSGELTNGTYADSRWRYTVRYDVVEQHFVDKIALMVEALQPHKAFLKRLRDSGGTISLIVQFLGDDGYFGDQLPVGLIEKLADYQIELGIEVYSVPQISNDETVINR